jgi:hypothetical protein
MNLPKLELLSIRWVQRKTTWQHKWKRSSPKMSMWIPDSNKRWMVKILRLEPDGQVHVDYVQALEQAEKQMVAMQQEIAILKEPGDTLPVATMECDVNVLKSRNTCAAKIIQELSKELVTARKRQTKAETKHATVKQTILSLQNQNMDLKESYKNLKTPVER